MSFKINYSGDGKGVLYTYQCAKCEHIQEVVHGMMEEPKIKCSVKKCKGKCTRVILKAPSLDADHHDRMLSHNLDWD